MTLPYAFGTRRIEARFVPDIGPDELVRGVVVHAIDVTERYEAEAERERLLGELRAERQKLRTIFEQAPAFLALLKGPQFEFEYVNKAYQGLIGHREVIGKAVLEAIPEVADQGFLELLTGVLESEEPFIGQEVPILLKRTVDGEPEKRFLDFAYQPMYDASGTPYGVIAHGVDVTDHVVARNSLIQSEQRVRQLNEDLELRVKERTQELQDAIRQMEGFNYSIAHDLRAPLRAIVSTANILQSELSGHLMSSHRELLERQVFNATRLSRLIDELLRLSRLSRAEVTREKLDMTALVKAVATDLNPARHVEIQPDMVAFADYGLVRTVVENLVGNAYKFSSADSTVKVGQTDGNFWVNDAGVGFDMKFVSKLFQPFERLVTEDEFEGTGIGLANVDRIVRRHHGQVWADSEPGHGSTFYFTLGDRKQ
jgi:PAS domain S-box-containing protein